MVPEPITEIFLSEVIFITGTGTGTGPDTGTGKDKSEMKSFTAILVSVRTGTNNCFSLIS